MKVLTVKTIMVMRKLYEQPRVDSTQLTASVTVLQAGSPTPPPFSPDPVPSGGGGD